VCVFVGFLKGERERDGRRGGGEKEEGEGEEMGGILDWPFILGVQGLNKVAFECKSSWS
jgi:hypothetical protein